jgi:hypothetical protein
MSDPISRLEVCRREIDRVFGDGHAAAHPELVAAIMQSAAIDQAAMRLSAALEFIGRALVIEDETMPSNGPIVRPQALVRP